MLLGLRGSSILAGMLLTGLLSAGCALTGSEPEAQGPVELARGATPDPQPPGLQLAGFAKVASERESPPGIKLNPAEPSSEAAAELPKTGHLSDRPYLSEIPSAGESAETLHFVSVGSEDVEPSTPFMRVAGMTGTIESIDEKHNQIVVHFRDLEAVPTGARLHLFHNYSLGRLTAVQEYRVVASTAGRCVAFPAGGASLIRARLGGLVRVADPPYAYVDGGSCH